MRFTRIDHRKESSTQQSKNAWPDKRMPLRLTSQLFKVNFITQLNRVLVTNIPVVCFLETAAIVANACVDNIHGTEITGC